MLYSSAVTPAPCGLQLVPSGLHCASSAVEVLTFRAMVLLTIRASEASSIEMPPPMSVAMLLTTILFRILMR